MWMWSRCLGRRTSTPTPTYTCTYTHTYRYTHMYTCTLVAFKFLPPEIPLGFGREEKKKELEGINLH